MSQTSVEKAGGIPELAPPIFGVRCGLNPDRCRKAFLPNLAKLDPHRARERQNVGTHLPKHAAPYVQAEDQLRTWREMPMGLLSNSNLTSTPGESVWEYRL